MQSFFPFQKFAKIISKGSIKYITCKQKQKRCVGGGGVVAQTNPKHRIVQYQYIFLYIIFGQDPVHLTYCSFPELRDKRKKECLAPPKINIKAAIQCYILLKQ